jgi:phosphoribosylformylglycinamidine (FGAM) synthase PurS component
MSKMMTIVLTENQYETLMQCINSMERSLLHDDDIEDYKTVKKKILFAWEKAPRTPGSRS